MPGYRPQGQLKYYHITGSKLVIANHLQRVIYNSCLIVPAYLIICIFIQGVTGLLSSEFGVYFEGTLPLTGTEAEDGLLLLYRIKCSLSLCYN